MNDVWQGGYPCTGCGGSCTSFSTASGTFSDGSGASVYSANSDCSWIIAPIRATSVTITFDSMELESGYDFIDIFSCAEVYCDRDKTIWIAKISGTETGSYTVSTPYMLVKFTTDFSVQYGGFSASWTSLDTVCMLLFSFSFANVAFYVVWEE
jgi:hypothetical protein